MISLVLFEKYQRDKSNDTKKGHKCWPECATWVVWRQMNPNIFGQLVWPNSVTVRDLPCCRWICFIDIFPIVSMVSLLEFCCVFEVFFFLSFLIFLSILSLFLFGVNCVSLFLILERVADDTCNSKVVDVIYDSLNCATLLNSFCTILFYPFFKC
jgi:hypothetical protein